MTDERLLIEKTECPTIPAEAPETPTWDRYVCVDCGIPSPPATSPYALISPLHGWRLVRKRSATSDFDVDWRCGTCWELYRARAAGQRAP
jgi:hypothetical protein